MEDNSMLAKGLPQCWQKIMNLIVGRPGVSKWQVQSVLIPGVGTPGK
jgi:hypothetical protein